MHRKLLGNDHVEVARSLSALAYALYEQGRFGESEDAARKALAIQARLSAGEPIWDDEPTRARLGFALYRQHKLDEAEVVLRQAVKFNRIVLHPCGRRSPAATARRLRRCPTL
jgi:tetratricopeptide (TPR) repeat protein